MRGVMSADDVLFLGPDGLISDTFIQGAADAAEGAWLTFAGYTADKLLENGGPGADYVTRISERLGLGEGDQPDAYAVYSYETVVVTLQAIERAAEADAPRSQRLCSARKALSVFWVEPGASPKPVTPIPRSSVWRGSSTTRSPSRNRSARELRTMTLRAEHQRSARYHRLGL